MEMPTSEAEHAPSATVDPGQIIRINAHFPGEPANVMFSWLAPGAAVAQHDPGAGNPASQIKRDGNLYSFWIDTQEMRGGEGWWYFFSKDDDLSKRRAKVGTFIVRDVPDALLNRFPPHNAVTTIIGGDSGLHLLGADASDDASDGTKVLVGAGIGLALGLLLAH